MNEIAMTASFMRLSVYQKILASCTGPNPSNRPATIAAKKHPVPVAESQLKSYRAASGVSLVTTGAARVTSLWSKGTFQFGVVARLMAPLMDGSPPGIAARSSSNLQTCFGRQNRRKATVATNETTPPAMSTRFESTWLDQRYCVTLKDVPTTRLAGSNSNVSAQPTIAGGVVSLVATVAFQRFWR